MFEKYGEILSLKISFNGDHTSKGFAYIKFKTVEAAEAAIRNGPNLNHKFIVAVPYGQQNEEYHKNHDSNNDEIMKNGNNLYV